MNFEVLKRWCQLKSIHLIYNPRTSLAPMRAWEVWTRHHSKDREQFLGYLWENDFIKRHHEPKDDL